MNEFLTIAGIILFTIYAGYGIVLLVGDLDESLNSNVCVPPKYPIIHFPLTFFHCLIFAVLWPVTHLLVLLLCLWMDAKKFYTDRFPRKRKA